MADQMSSFDCKEVDVLCSFNPSENDNKKFLVCEGDVAEHDSAKTTVTNKKGTAVLEQLFQHSHSENGTRTSGSKRSTELFTASDSESECEELGAPSSVQPSQPSVYSSIEIRRHNKRLKRAMEEEEGSDSDEHDEEPEENRDCELDVNLRIFEETCNGVVGEISVDNVVGQLMEIARTKMDAASNQITSIEEIRDADEKEEKHVIQSILDDFDDPDPDDPADCIDILSDTDFEEMNFLMTSKTVNKNKPKSEKRATKQRITKDPITDVEDSNDRGNFVVHDLLVDCFSNNDEKTEDVLDSNDKQDPFGKQDPFSLRKKSGLSDESLDMDDPLAESEPEIESENVNALPTPMLKLNAKGEIVIDRSTLVIEQTGVAEKREAIANSKVLDASDFRYKSNRESSAGSWTPLETLKFYHVLSNVGTNFDIMATFFPGRSRSNIKRKYKSEEKLHPDAINQAVFCPRRFDMAKVEQEIKIAEKRMWLAKQDEKESKKAAKKAERLKKRMEKMEKKKNVNRKCSIEK